MARPLRLEFSGALYHITSRGNHREDIYDGVADKELFISVLDEVCRDCNWVCHAYCLMSNHYHLLIETPDANLSKGMRQLNGIYTQSYNRSHGRSGHLFQGRYKAILVEKESYLLELARYIVLNPVRASMVRSAKDWRWSSYRATVGQARGPSCLRVDWLLSAFSEKAAVAIDCYKQFIAKGKGQPSPFEKLRNQVYLGGDEFVERMKLYIDTDSDLSEIPSPQRRCLPKSLPEYESLSQDRNSAIAIAYESGGYTLKELGVYFGLHYSTISGLIKSHKSKT